MKWIVYVMTSPHTSSLPADKTWFHCHPEENVRRSEHLQQQATVYRAIEIEADTYWEAQRQARQVIDVERRLEAAIA